MHKIYSISCELMLILCLFFETDSELTAEDFSIVHEKLYKARTKWHNIGLELGVDFETLESICLKFRDCHDECLKKMLACRLQSHGPLTWRGLCDCLKSERVGRNDVAQEIEKWLHPVEGTATYIQSA